MEKVSIIIPVIRPEKAKRCIDAIVKNVGIPDDQYEWLSLEDKHDEGCPKMVEHLTRSAMYDLVMFLGDDTIPQPGFLKAALDEMAKLPDGWGVVGLNTEDPRGSNPLAHWLAHKKMLEHIPGGAFFPVDYKHCYCDNELKDIAEELGRWKFAENSKIKHYHPVNKTAEWDEGYSKAYDNGAWDHDRKTYFKRKIERNRAKHGTRLGIAWPIIDLMIHTNFVFSFITMHKQGYDFFVPEYRGHHDTVRNNLVRQALNAGVTHLWMTDTDQIYFDTDTLDKMLAHESPIVSLPVMRRYPPFDPLLWRRGKDGKNEEVPFDEIKKAFDEKETIEVHSTGMGSVLFDMDVFVNIDPPWFKLPEHGEQGPGEDVYFWDKAYRAGYSILTDCSVNVEHITTMGAGWNTHLLFRKFNHMEAENGKRE